jgi:hypothetical protein
MDELHPPDLFIHFPDNSGTRIRDLPSAKKKELEVVLTTEKDGQNWTHLATELGECMQNIILLCKRRRCEPSDQQTS